MPLNLTDAIQRQYDALNKQNTGGQPRPAAPNLEAQQKQFLSALQQAPRTLRPPMPFASDQTAKDLPLGTFTSALPPEATKPPQPFAPTPISDATARVQAAVPKMNAGFAGVVGAGLATVEQMGKGLGGAWGKTKEGDVGAVPFDTAMGGIPMIGLGVKSLEKIVPQTKPALSTPLRDIPGVGAVVRGAEALGGAANAGFETIGEPVATATAINREITPKFLKDAVRNPATQAASPLAQLLANLWGKDNPQLFEAAGSSKEEAEPLMRGLLAGTNTFEQNKRLEQIVRGGGASEAEANPVPHTILSAAADPLTYLDVANVMPMLSNIQEVRRLWQAGGDVTNARQVTGATNPLNELIAKAFQPADVADDVIKSRKDLRIVEPQDTTVLKRTIDAFRKTPVAQVTETVQRAASNLMPYLNDIGRPLDDKVRLLKLVHEAARVEKITPELQAAMKQWGIANSEDFHRVLRSIGNYDPTPVVARYQRAQSIREALEQTTRTTTPGFNPQVSEFALSEAENLGGGYKDVFTRVIDGWKEGKLDLDQMREGIEKVAGIQLSADVTAQMGATLAKIAKIQPPNPITNIVNGMRRYEGLLFVGANPASMVQNVLNDMSTLVRKGGTLRTEAQADEFLARMGLRYDDNLGNAIRKEVGAPIEDRGAYGSTAPHWTRKIPGLKQVGEAFETTQRVGRKAAYATGVERHMNRFVAPPLPPRVKVWLGKDATRIERALAKARNSKEVGDILFKNVKTWAHYTDEIADELKSMFSQVAGREVPITAQQASGALPLHSQQNINRVLRRAQELAEQGVTPADAWEIARKDVYGDDIFGDAAESAKMQDAANAAAIETNVDLFRKITGREPTPEEMRELAYEYANLISKGIYHYDRKILTNQLGYNYDELMELSAEDLQNILKKRIQSAQAPQAKPVEPTEAPLSPTEQQMPDWMNANMETAFNALTPAQRSQLEELAAQRKTAQEIADALGLDRETVMFARSKMGIPSQTRGIGFGQQPNPDFETWVKGRQATPPVAPAAPAPNIIEQVKARAAQITQPKVNKALLDEWADLFHEGAPKNEIRAIHKAIAKWTPEQYLEKAQSWVTRARAEGHTWVTMMADMFEERAHYVIEQMAAGNPKYNTPEYMERVANGDALTRMLRGGANGFDWTKLEQPYDYKPYESFAQYRKRVTNAAIERDFGSGSQLQRPAGDTSPVAPSAGTGSATSPSAEVGATNRAGDVAASKTFKTEKGSTYTVETNGTTTRNKAPRPEHPGDAGMKPTSEKTYYITPENALKLSEAQARGIKASIQEVGDGTIGLRYTGGKSAGKFERRTVIPFETEPRVGLQPLETWDNGAKHHFGNKIVEVGGAGGGGDVKAAPAAVAPARAAEGAKEAWQQTKAEYEAANKFPEVLWNDIFDKAKYVSRNGDVLITITPSTVYEGGMRANFWTNQGIVEHVELKKSEVAKFLRREAYERGKTKIIVEGGAGGTFPSASYASAGFRPAMTTAKGDVKVFVGPTESAEWMAQRLGSGGYKTRIELTDKTTREVGYSYQNFKGAGSTPRHDLLVQQALSEGKPVPAEVLADYPDLAPAPKAQGTGEFAASLGRYGIKETGFPNGGYYIVDAETGETLRFGKKVGEMPKKFKDWDAAYKKVQELVAKDRAGLDVPPTSEGGATLDAGEPTLDPLAQVNAARFQALAEKMRQAGAGSVMDSELNKQTLDAMEQALLDRLAAEFGADAVKQANVMPADVQQEMNAYQKQFMGALNNELVKAQAMGRFFQDSTTLNYDGAWNIETALLLERPFVHWWLHSALNYTRDFIDHPAMLAFALHLSDNLQKESERLIAEGKLPERYRGSFKLELPVELPGLGDTLWINPMRTLFPFEDVLQLNALQRAKYSDGEGDLGGVINDVFGVHVPIKLAWNALAQDWDEFQNTFATIPLNRQLKAFSGGFGVEGKYDKFYNERAMKELVATGEITEEDAKVAMLTRKGEAWTKIQQRANAENYTAKEGSAMFGMRGKVYTPGEQKYNESMRAKEQMLDNAVRQLGGNPNMDDTQRYEFLSSKGFYGSPDWLQFKEQYPETDLGGFLGAANAPQAEGATGFPDRLPEDKVQQERARQYYLDAIQTKYYNVPELKQKLIAADLGDQFKSMFLNKEAKDWDKIPLRTILGWANAIDALLQDPVAGTQMPQPEPFRVTFTTDDQNKRYQAHYDEINAAFGGSDQKYAIEQGYWALPAGEARKQYLAKNPKLKVLWDTEKEFYNENPDILNLLVKAGLKKPPAATSSNPQGSAFTQALTAVGYTNYEEYQKEKDAFYALPEKSDARTNYLAQHSRLGRMFAIGKQLYATDEELQKKQTAPKLPNFHYNPKNTYYGKSYGAPNEKKPTRIYLNMRSVGGGQQRPPQNPYLPKRVTPGGY